MRIQSLFYIFILFILFSSCEKEDEPVFQETGIVKDLQGTGNCGFVIELENGSVIHPLYFPKSFVFAEGQKVYVEYIELENIVSSCNQGINCEIRHIENLGCTPVIGLITQAKDTFRNDAVALQEIKLNGNCISVRLSFSGGCREHKVYLVCMKPIKNSNETPILEIRHNANNDMCEAWITRDYVFDITELRKLEIKKIQIRAIQNNGSYIEKEITL